MDNDDKKIYDDNENSDTQLKLTIVYHSNKINANNIQMAVHAQCRPRATVNRHSQYIETSVLEKEAHKYYPSIFVHQYDVNVSLANPDSCSEEKRAV